VILRTHWPILLVLVLFLALGVVYSVVNPLFESPDEVWHYEYVRWLVEDRGLPRPEQVGEAPWHQEGSQPPLYYLMAALLTKPIPTDNAGTVIRYNPHAAIGQPDAFGNRNMIVHSSADDWPWRGVVLAAHVTRLFSLLLGAVTVLSTYGTAWAILPGHRAFATLAAAIVAFNPQFIFLSSAVNNDNLVIALSAAGGWLLVSLLAQRKAPSFGQLILLGLLIGMAALSKLSGLALAGLAGLTLLLVAWRQRRLKALIRWGFVVAGVALLVAGWWYWRNWQLYGDPLALQAMFDILPRRPEPPTLEELLARAEGVWRSTWAVFGWFNVTVDEWVYQLYTVLTAAGLAGLFVAWPIRLIRERDGENSDIAEWRTQALPWQLLVLFLWIVVIGLALLNWAQMRYPQGRLLFPAIGAASVFISLGLAGWVPNRYHRVLAAMVAGGLLVVAAMAPFRWILPAYSPPSVLALPATLSDSGHTDFAQQVRLLGYEIDGIEARPGEEVGLTLYWQALEPPPVNYSVFVHLVDENGILQAQRDSYPGAGTLPTSVWQPGDVIADRHVVTIPETALAPHRLRVDVGVYDYETGQRLPTPGGDSVALGYIALLPRGVQADVPNPVAINFENQIALVGFELDRQVMEPGDTLELTLWWEALDVPELDYVVFTHLVLPPEAVWAQQDQMPQGGQAPTSSWQLGQRFEDHYRLTLPAEAPAGVYFIEIGLYDRETNDRLKVNFSDKGVVLGQVRVEETSQTNGEP
jgi:4-amino-4-deoxy-L-arabinose transferase-like glycosyltransferase